MFTLIKRRGLRKSDPAPSRWAWRMQRLMLTPAFLLGVRIGLPFALTLIAGTIYFSDETRRAAIGDTVAEIRASIEERPEFMVNLLAIDGAEDALAAEIRTLMPFEFPQSSFDIDIEVFRGQITALSAVQRADVRIRPGGILHVAVTPRVPVVVWRHAQGLALLDAGGAHVKDVPSRKAAAGLPLIAGEGAARHVPEALRLLRIAGALDGRVRGLVRMGARRWDVVLDRDQRILLPEEGAEAALERVIALETVEEVLSRDVARVDMRLVARPTVQMTQEAVTAWWQMTDSAGE
ncbi:MAG: cell division protein FtsQ/DivIB [Pseudomonadota bacterium]